MYVEQADGGGGALVFVVEMFNVGKWNVVGKGARGELLVFEGLGSDIYQAVTVCGTPRTSEAKRSPKIAAGDLRRSHHRARAV